MKANERLAVDEEVKEFLEKNMKPRETFNEVLRRLLKIDKEKK